MLPGGHALKLAERKAVQKVAENICKIYEISFVESYQVAKKLHLSLICSLTDLYKLTANIKSSATADLTSECPLR
jgi:NMD protein affecting ribosome stability and mRNA decay